MNILQRTAAAAIAGLALVPSTAQAESARSADAFVDSVGVSTHVIFDDTAYGNFATVRADLKELGVRHIRDGLCGTCGWQLDRYRALGGDGIKLDAIVGKPTDSPTTLAGNIAEAKALGGSVDAVEGANEWDSMSGHASSWATQDRDYQQWLWNSIHGDAALSRIAVIGPSLVFGWLNPSSWTTLGNISATADYGNSHAYPGGRAPETVLDGELANAAKTTPGKPLIVTEAGYHNALQQTNWDHPAVPESVAAAYTQRMFLEYFRRGVARTYGYELLDERPGKAATDQEQSFGLVRADYTRKPAFDALRNLLATLSDVGSPVPAVDVPMSLSSSASDVQHLLLTKRSGEVDLVLWRTASLWNTSTRTLQAVSPVSVHVTPGRQLLTAGVVDPAVSATTTPLAPAAGGVDVSVGASPVVVRLTLGASAQATPSYAADVNQTPGLLRYWRLDGSDSAGYVGLPARTSGALAADSDTATTFNGVDQEVTAAAPAVTNAATLEGWFDWKAGTVLMRDNTTLRGWILAYDYGGSVALRGGGTMFVTPIKTASLQNGWHYYALTKDGGTVTLYVDGKAVYTAAGAAGEGAASPWHIMRNGLYGAGNYTRGSADDVAVYDQALPATTIARHYQLGRG